MSQFWYDKATSEKLSKEVLTNALNVLKSNDASSFNIACISCPTLFKSLYSYLRELKSHPDLPDLAAHLHKIDIKLFEYDKRFEMYGEDFLFYDYKNPLAIDAKYHQYFDFVISDPPYLSDECHVKTGMTIKKITRNDFKLLICTGIKQNIIQINILGFQNFKSFGFLVFCFVFKSRFYKLYVQSIQNFY